MNPAAHKLFLGSRNYICEECIHAASRSGTVEEQMSPKTSCTPEQSLRNAAVDSHVPMRDAIESVEGECDNDSTNDRCTSDEVVGLLIPDELKRSILGVRSFVDERRPTERAQDSNHIEAQNPVSVDG